MTDSRSLPYPLGVTPLPEGGAHVAVYSETADRVWFCLFDGDGDGDAADGTERRFELTNRTGHVFHTVVEEARVGSLYGLRVAGPWDPAAGLRHNEAKLLLDPYATALHGRFDWGQAVFGHDMDEPETRDDTDSAAAMPRNVIADRDFDWGSDERPLTALEDTVVYEVHVKGFTRQHPDVPEEIRGTYAGLAHPAAIKHFTDLGVTAVELLPTHQFVQDSHLE